MVRLAVTLGDPAGIGPEVTQAGVRVALSTLPHLSVVLFGPAGIADRLADELGPAAVARTQDPFAAPRGRPTAASGRAALAALAQAIQAAQLGEVDGLVTAPLSKEALAMAGCQDRGHTAILARELGSGPVAMAFLGERMRVVLASEHVPLREVLDTLTPQRIVEVATLLAETLRIWAGVCQPRLALAALNPHASEGGLMGSDERHVLIPAVEGARLAGIDLVGPLAADSLFRRAYDGEFDGVVALYHDQGLIPVKMLGMGETVNVTLGLKVPRTSPDHGTAFDRVGTPTVRAEGMVAALRMAASLARGC